MPRLFTSRLSDLIRQYVLDYLVRKAYQVKDTVPNNNGSFGACTHCGETATKQALFKQSGAVIIEKYCDGCVQAEKFSALITFY